MQSIASTSALAVIFLLTISQQSFGEIFRQKFMGAPGYLVIEVLDDNLLHFEVSAVGSGPPVDQPLYTSPMVLKTDYSGPTSLTQHDNVIETPDLTVTIDGSNLCATVAEKIRQRHLATLCPVDLRKPFKGLDIDPGAIRQVYGLGQEFKNLSSADGDWTALGIRQGMDLGNGFQGFFGGANGNVQIPVMYAVGNDNLNYALFMDNVYKQSWDFTKFWWQTRMFGDQVRFYIMGGADLPSLRAAFMQLTGMPPVPPRKAFGLWVSEFGYDNFSQIDVLETRLREAKFPVDGFVLDLNWFGGIVLNDPSRSEMGRLDWDEDQPEDAVLPTNPYSFPDPEHKIPEYAAQHIGVATIEESYLATPTRTFREIPAELTAYQRRNGHCDETSPHTPVTDVKGFWGEGKMIDWSNPAAGAWIHEHRRFPDLVDKGVTVHWTDLGEPENFRGDACYQGVERTLSGPKNEHADIHNLYNLLWNKSIWDGYFNEKGQPDGLREVNPRPFILTRSGAAGTQRYGAAMWSGDIASRLDVLATHLNAQMHMSFSGIDFYGADIGGFRRETLPYNDDHGRYRGYENEMYTQWFANGAWFDVPVRPHTDNEFKPAAPRYETAPNLVGHVPSNLANIRQRYELIPYYYALAYRAHLLGEPVAPPLVFYHQNDPNVRGLGHEKLIGRDLLVGVVARHGEYERDLYLPAGRWINYHTNESIVSSGESVRDVPVYRDGVFRVPVFARAGTILPQMYVDDATRDTFGARAAGAAPHDELIVKVYADAIPSQFTLYEDDGRTLNYRDNGRPFYHHRTTLLRQQQQGNSVTVTIEPATNVNGNGPFSGAVTTRQNIVRLVVDNAQATGVSLNGAPLPRIADESAFAGAPSGWFNAGNNLILAKSEPMDVSGVTKTFTFTLQPVPPVSSVNFACDHGFTNPGEGVYVAGSLQQLGGFDPARAIKLEPSVYYEYISQPPPGHSGPGPSAPVWTGVVAGLPADTAFQWKCLIRREDGTGAVRWQPGDNNAFRTTAAGYAGRSYGTF